jgi:hypothetical protein
MDSYEGIGGGCRLLNEYIYERKVLGVSRRV